MPQPPSYGNLEEAPIYGNIEDSTHIYFNYDYETEEARNDLPPLPPKPQKGESPKFHKRTSLKPQIRSSWISNRISARFQGLSMNIMNKTKNENQSNTIKKPKQIAARTEKKEAIERQYPANNASPPSATDSFSSTSSESLNQASGPVIPNENVLNSSKTKVTTSNKSICSSKCCIILLVALLILSVAGAVVYFKYTKEIMCFVGYGECSGILDIFN